MSSLGRKVLTSSSLLVGIKFFQRLVGLISILILARLLTPEDFAIIALVSIIVHFFDILSNAGSEQYIIQKVNVSKADLNTAWSIDITMKSALWFLLIISAQFTATFFGHPELEKALYFSSFILIINAAKNPGLFLKKQNFEYGEIFWLSVTQRIITFILVIGIAYFERSYWALIFGDIFSSIIFTLGSYQIDKHRPKICFNHLKKQWSFSGWMFLKSIIGYTRSQIDTLIVSKYFPAAQLGHYFMARDLAMMPSHNLLLPAIEPLLAVFRTSKYSTEKLGEHVRLSLFIVAMISVPITVFIWNYPGPIINTILGDQWTGAQDLLSVLAILFFYYSFVQVLEKCLMVLNKVRALFYYDVISLVVITSILLLLISNSLVDFGFLRGVLGILTMVGLLLYTNLHTQLKLSRFFILIIPILISTVCAYLATQTWGNFLENSEYVLLDLLLKLSIFCVTYPILLAVILILFAPQISEFNKVKTFILTTLQVSRY